MRLRCTGFLTGAALVAVAAGAGAQDRTRISTKLQEVVGGNGEFAGEADYASRGDDARFVVRVRGLETGTALRLLVGGVEVASTPADRGCRAEFAFRTDAGGGGDDGGSQPLGAGNGEGGDDGVGDLPGNMEIRCIRTRGEFGDGGGRSEGWQPLGFDPRGQTIEVATAEETLLSGRLGPDSSFQTRVDETVSFEPPAGEEEGSGTLRFTQRKGVRQLRVDVDDVRDGELLVFVNGSERGSLAVSGGRGRAQFSGDDGGDDAMDLDDLGGPVELRSGSDVVLAAELTEGAEEGDGGGTPADDDGGGVPGGGGPGSG